MTSFGAMLDATKGIVDLIKITDKDRYLSYLPVAHGMERWLGEVRGSRRRPKQDSFFIMVKLNSHAPCLLLHIGRWLVFWLEYLFRGISREFCY
jgi:hypothetical protein